MGCTEGFCSCPVKTKFLLANSAPSHLCTFLLFGVDESAHLLTATIPQCTRSALPTPARDVNSDFGASSTLSTPSTSCVPAPTRGFEHLLLQLRECGDTRLDDAKTA